MVRNLDLNAKALTHYTHLLPWGVCRHLRHQGFLEMGLLLSGGVGERVEGRSDEESQGRGGTFPLMRPLGSLTAAWLCVPATSPPVPLPDASLLISHLPLVLLGAHSARAAALFESPEIISAYESIRSLARLCSPNGNAAGSKIYLILNRLHTVRGWRLQKSLCHSSL